MPTCVKCGFWDETNAEFDSTGTICLGCEDQPAEVPDHAEPEWEEDAYGNFRAVYK